MNNRILVLGMGGQLGSELKNLYPEYHHQFFFTGRSALNIQDIDQIEQFVRTYQVNTIINAAAYTQVDAAESNKELAQSINADSAESLGNICLRNNIKLIHVSTDYVFDGLSDHPYKEDTPINPQTVYGASKAQGELLLRKINLPNTAIIRTSWVFSNYGHNFVKTILRLAKEKNSIKVVSDQLGRPTYAKDLAKTILDIIPQISSQGVEVYHYANKGETNWFEFAKEIVNLANLSCEILPIKTSEYPTPAKRPAYSILDTSKIEHTFGANIPHWHSGLSNVVDNVNHE